MDVLIWPRLGACSHKQNIVQKEINELEQGMPLLCLLEEIFFLKNILKHSLYNFEEHFEV